ncbi:MAG TPA: hypothetical protein VGR51_09540 [Thermoplasmata archaeon]|jgi:hypothetical protein|nr:hypothetical protein [Thermoplasmata archaeon]
MADATQIWTAIGFCLLLGVGTVLAVGAYWSLRHMDDVVLKARIYMNRRRLFAGFLALAMGMVTFFALVLVALGFQLANAPMPSSTVTAAFVLFLGFLAWGFYNFYALARTPALAEREVV